MFDRYLMLMAAYLKGWDAALVYRDIGCNPYHRVDYRNRWEHGFRDCEATAINTRPGFRRFDDENHIRLVLNRIKNS